jgi:Arc/MetJ family transcription regulator
MTHKTVDIETSELRKRVRAAIDHSRRAAAARRAQLDEAAVAYNQMLETIAAPLARMLVNALRAEGYNFTVFTPNGGLRLASARSAEDFIEFALDTSQVDPVVILRVNQARGRRLLQHERTVKGNTPASGLTEEDVLQALLEELGPFLER